jgi:cholesterol transport system auxiliary component
MGIRRSLLGLAALASLSACIGGGSKPPAYLFALDAAQPRPADAGQRLPQGQIIAVGLPIQPRLIATSRIAVMNAPQGVAYLPDAAWVDLPAPLFQQLLAETITARGARVALPVRQLAGMDGPRLGGELTMFGLDHATNEAVVTFDATLSDSAGGDIRTRRFQHRVGTSLRDPRKAANAIEQAANGVAADIADWVAQN